MYSPIYIDELDQQIPRMGSIYANAKQVLVWLGPEADESDLAMELINEDFCDTLLAKNLFLSDDLRELESARRLNVVVKLFARPWWQCGWIIQEVIGGRRCRDNVIIHCGHSQKQWESFSSAIEDVDRKSWSGRLRNDQNMFELDRLGKLAPLLKTRYLAHASASDIEKWLTVLRDFQTTEPKDKFWIACLLSQGNGSISGLSPQYRWSMKETYVFIVRGMLESCQSLRVLEHYSTLSDLPSWVPDWRSPGPTPLSRWRSDPFRACGTSRLVYEISGDAHLHLTGWLLDFAESFPPLETGPSDLKQKAVAMGPTYKATGENSVKALIRVAHLDLSKDIQAAYEWIVTPAKERQKLGTLVDYRAGPDGEIDILETGFFQDAILSSAAAVHGRKYFVSANSLIGLVPEASQEGDKICFFMGGKTPFVIRPVGEHYQLIGAFYVHGVIYGEAMTVFETIGWPMQDSVLV
jgi:hypothetical protein